MPYLDRELPFTRWILDRDRKVYEVQVNAHPSYPGKVVVLDGDRVVGDYRGLRVERLFSSRYDALVALWKKEFKSVQGMGRRKDALERAYKRRLVELKMIEDNLASIDTERKTS